ncbi:MAG TPA: hypothetical protein EYQ34_06580 [Acidimicrobiia bacterium]|nr:hypothetical protein [Acidimicrobiia bacterium]
MNDRTGRRNNNGRDNQKRSGGPQRKEKSSRREPPKGRDRRGSSSGPDGRRSDGRRSDGRRSDGRRSDGRGSDSPQRGPGVEKPERHFGDKARGSKWGGVARRGAHNASIDPGGPRPSNDDVTRPPRRDDDRWERVNDSSRSQEPRRRQPQLPLPELDDVHTRDLSERDRNRLLKQLREAGEQFLSERFGAVEDILRPLVKKHPRVPDLQELYGLTLYRLGLWRQALDRLERFTYMTGTVDQLPVMADCHRALGEYDAVRRLWDELRVAGPEASVMTEGRIVMAGALADVGDLAGGIRLLEKGPIQTKKARDYHLRLWYALSDLYERAGDHQRASRGFERIRTVEPDYADVAYRLTSLS